MSDSSDKAPAPALAPDTATSGDATTPGASTAAAVGATSVTEPPAEPSPSTTAPAAATESVAEAAAGTTADEPDTTSTDAPSPDAENPDILPASHWVQQPLIDETDGDSAYGDDNASSTASLTASILEYRTVQGRRFHSEIGNAQSWNPNDAQHEESMDILHHVSTLLQDGKLYLAPIDQNVQKVLDVGCGTGIWAIDFADQFPGTEVIGVDISAQQTQWIPPNLRFEVDDITQPWTYKENSFDYIHMRWLVGAIQDWPGLYREVYMTLKPGGWFENKESSCIITSDDGTVFDGSALDQWGKVFVEAGKKCDRSFRVVEDAIQRKAMEEAGFVDIREHYFKARA
ncbi:hypothetical protein AAE478_009123 [Parahypoxylon ruwenzoriense]